jgi:hypothetical protein
LKIEYYRGPNPGVVPRIGKDPTPRNYNGMDLSRWTVGMIRDLPESIAHSFLANGCFRKVIEPPKAPSPEKLQEAPPEEKPVSKKKT